MLSIVKGPYLQNPTGHSMTVMWKRRSLQLPGWTSCMLREYIADIKGTTSSQFTFRYFCRWVSNTDTPNQRGGPRAGTTYYYKVYSQHESDEIESDFYMLKTAAGQGEPFSLR